MIQIKKVNKIHSGSSTMFIHLKDIELKLIKRG